MRWFIVMLWLGSVVAHAAPKDTTLQNLARQANEARLAEKLSQAVQLYQKALKLHPDWSEGWWWLGSIYYDQDLYSDARIAFEHAIADDRKMTASYGFLGLCAYEMRDYTAARAYLGKWHAAGELGDASLVDVAGFRRAELLTQDGHFFEALFQLNRQIGAHGPIPSLVEAMGLAWMQMKNVPEDYPSEKREMVWLAGSAAAWFSASKVDRAREFLARLETHYGDQPNVHFLKGFVDEATKDDEAAIEDYRKELKVAPQAVAPMIQLALLYAESGRNDEALALARSAVMLEPGNARSHFALGHVLLTKQQWADSCAELEKAKAISPEASNVRFQLSKVYRRLGRTQDAQSEEAVFESLQKREEGHPALESPASLAPSQEGGSR